MFTAFKGNLVRFAETVDTSFAGLLRWFGALRPFESARLFLYFLFTNKATTAAVTMPMLKAPKMDCMM